MSNSVEYEALTPEMASWICTAGLSAEGIPPEKMRQIVSVGRFTPQLLSAIGCDDLEIVTAVSVLEKMVFDHSISTDFLVRLHAILCTPARIFRSASQAGSVVVMTLEVQRGNPIVIPVHLNKPQSKGQPSVHWVSSAYAKDNPGQLSRWEKEGLLLWPSA